MSETVLVVNAGSSSIKFQLFSVASGDRLERRLKGQIEGVAVKPHLIARGVGGDTLIDETWPASEVKDVPAALDKVVGFLRAHIGELPTAIGHRVVHGGPDYSAPTVITEAVLKRLDTFSPLAPLHQPNNLGPDPRGAGAAAATPPSRLLRYGLSPRSSRRGRPLRPPPGASMTRACAVTASTACPTNTLPTGSQASLPILPRAAPWSPISAAALRCAQFLPGRAWSAPWVSPRSTALPMGTRPGQLDPGIILYLLDQKGMSAKDVERFLYSECGLKGLSGISNDVRDLLESQDPRAKLALDHFVYRIALSAGMLASAMGGIDGLVFTAGIGENAPRIREAVVKRLAWLGLELDAEANAKGGPRISREGSRVACYVIPTDEELMIARHTLHVLRAQATNISREKSA